MAIGDDLLLFFNLGDANSNVMSGYWYIYNGIKHRLGKIFKSINNAAVCFGIGSYGVYLANVFYLQLFSIKLFHYIMRNAQ